MYRNFFASSCAQALLPCAMFGSCLDRQVPGSPERTASLKKLGETSLKTRAVLRFALPHCQYTPSSLPQFLHHAPVALTISVDLLVPKLDVRGWFAGSRTAVAVPETAVDEYRTLTTPEHNIGTAPQIPCVKAALVSEGETKTPD